jgi:hypothetical protein
MAPRMAATWPNACPIMGKPLPAGAARWPVEFPLGRPILELGGDAVQTGFPGADARDDFERALREARLARLAGWLSGRASGSGPLPVLGEVTMARGTRQELVPIDRIVGSVEPMMCFDRQFRPTSQLPRERFVRIDADVRNGRGMDPVELYHCDGHYYVEDGHHRIAVARALGERQVWATVTEVRPSRPATPAAG